MDEILLLMFAGQKMDGQKCLFSLQYFVNSINFLKKKKA